MRTHDFTAYLDHQPSEIELDALFEVGLDDATPEWGGSARPILHVSRLADTLAEAIVAVDQDLARAGLRMVGVQHEELVGLRDIADRTGRSYESVRLLANGGRGPGGFPAPVDTPGTWALYRWSQVAQWLQRNYGYDARTAEEATTLDAANHLLAARAVKADLSDIEALTHQDPLLA
ncbi:MAG: hypothetical protein LBJ08_07930 [Bifidobacteriaceae bacterium]|jgi:hypothetical protein|nr:hypothetical protein [Bifidobacteriaceae bacterium]